LAVRELHFAVTSNDIAHISLRHTCIYKVRTKKLRHFVRFVSGIRIARVVTEATIMEATDFTIQKTPCGGPLPELEIPMINTMVACLGVQHRKLNDLNMQLAYSATRLAADPGASEANQKVMRVWDEIRQDLWSHLQIEDGLVSWGEAHHAISGPLLGMLKNERQEMRKLVARLPERSSGVDGNLTAEARITYSRTLLALAKTLDSHIERYDSEVLPSILRALFPK
jgi:hypothetical protein